jgi:DNA-nicking Smr family endonuclease
MSYGIEERHVDFGEILKVWESTVRLPHTTQPANGTGGGKEKPVRTAADKQTAVARIQAEWLDIHGVTESPGRGDEESSPRRLTRKEIDSMPIDATLDLHGMTSMEAEIALDSFFARAGRTGCQKVLIVHGKGLHSKSEPVLANFVKLWLERQASAGRTGKADQADGGGGATWVLMKRGSDQRSR